MIVLGGFTRFPIFFTKDGRKSLGSRSNDPEVDRYVSSLKGKFVAPVTLGNVQYRSRFVTEHEAINPELKGKEDIPKTIYVYPDATPEKTLTNVLARGYVLKGGRKTVFVPCLCKRSLTKKEAHALLGITEVEGFGIDRVKVFMERLGMEFTVIQELAGQQTVIQINDPHVNEEYLVMVNREGRVMNVDFCVSNYRNLFLPELIMFVRQSRHIHHVGGFDY